jgi:Phenazine biosynthesis-like protein
MMVIWGAGLAEAALPVLSAEGLYRHNQSAVRCCARIAIRSFAFQIRLDEGVGSQCLFFPFRRFLRISHSPGQLAVFPDAAGIDERRMQRISNEMALPATTFVFLPRLPRATRGFAFSLHPETYRRKITPAVELGRRQTKTTLCNAQQGISTTVMSRQSVQTDRSGSSAPDNVCHRLIA